MEGAGGQTPLLGRPSPNPSDSKLLRLENKCRRGWALPNFRRTDLPRNKPTFRSSHYKERKTFRSGCLEVRRPDPPDRLRSGKEHVDDTRYGSAVSIRPRS